MTRITKVAAAEGGGAAAPASHELIDRIGHALARRRSEHRHIGAVTEAVLVWRHKSLRVPVENISKSGVMVRFSGPIAVGEEVHLEFDGFRGLAGCVQWVAQEKVGISLDEGAIDIVIM